MIFTMLSGMALTASAATDEDGNHICGDSDDCLVCEVAEMINALPAADDITIENAAAVTDQIHAIDRVKFELDDDQYDELLTLVDQGEDESGQGLGVPVRYMDAIEAVQNLDGGGYIAVSKVGIAGDRDVDVTDAKVMFKITGDEYYTEGQTLTLATLPMSQNGLASEEYYSYEGNGWTYGYNLPAGTYTIEEISDSGAFVGNEEFVTGTTSWSVNGSEPEVGKKATFTILPGKMTAVVFTNGLQDYSISFDNMTGGSVTVKNGYGEVMEPDDSGRYISSPYADVTLAPAPDEGYVFEKFSISYEDGYGETSEVEVEKDENDNYTFNMPRYDVTVKATFNKITYTVTVDDEITNGTVEADVEAAAEGDIVTLTVTPENGYLLDTLTCSDGTNEVSITVNDNGTCTFTMPASDVTITAMFQEHIHGAEDWFDGVCKVCGAVCEHTGTFHAKFQWYDYNKEKSGYFVYAELFCDVCGGVCRQ